LLKQRFLLNRFGVTEFARFGIESVYLPTYLDPTIWKLRVAGEKESVRDTIGVPKDAKVVTAIAENQERKNLGLMFEIVAQIPNLYLLLVTRRNTGVGWNIDDYLADLKIQDRVFIFERGLDISDLRALVVAADVYLSTSKAEGLAFPVLEAMATGVPVVAPDHTALHEHLTDGRGYLYNHAFKYRDPFGNEFRYFADLDSGVTAVLRALIDPTGEVVARARDYVEHCTLGPIARVLHEHIG
jgi:glycosyltransferase involved in cell wall biosynthesis